MSAKRTEALPTTDTLLAVIIARLERIETALSIISSQVNRAMAQQQAPQRYYGAPGQQQPPVAPSPSTEDRTHGEGKVAGRRKSAKRK